MRKIQARIHSLNGNFDECIIVEQKSDNNIIVEYKGKQCTAIYNPFAGCYYVDDIYGTIDI